MAKSHKAEDYLNHISKQDWYDKNFERIPKPDDWQPDKTFPEGHRKEGSPRCQQWKSKGGQCGQSPIKGKQKCSTHGGKASGGPSHGRYKHGRYTKSVANNPTVAKAYEEALKQQGILNLSPNIALTDARLDLLYETDIFSSDEIVKLADDTYQQWIDLKDTIPRNDPNTVEKIAKFNVNFEKLFEAMNSKNAFNKREDVLTERRRKLTETETKRQTATKEIVLKAEAIGIFAIMGGLLRDVVTNATEDKDAQREILEGFSKVIDTHIVGFFSSEGDKE